MLGTRAAAREKNKRRARRIYAVSLAIGALSGFVAYAWNYGPAYVAYWTYSPREGDILFQSLPRSELVNVIEGVSDSPYSHCGIVAKNQGNWVVLEAYQSVTVSPLKRFVFRGRKQGFAVYRLKAAHQQHIPATIHQARRYVGRPYDVRYQWDDEHIYCSELIYKAYRDATGGQQLGALARLSDLNWRPFESIIEHFEGGATPLDREIITPKHLAQAEQLDLVFVHRIATPRLQAHNVSATPASRDKPADFLPDSKR